MSCWAKDTTLTATINNKTILTKSMHKWFMLVRECLVLTLC